MFELGPRPADSALGTDVEPVGIEEGPLIMVAEDHQGTAIADQPGALAGIRAVTDDIAEAGDRIDLLLVDVSEHRLKRLEIAVDVADDRPLHANSTPLCHPQGSATTNLHPIARRSRRASEPGRKT